MLSTMVLLASMTITTDPNRHPYDIAQDYCSDRGGVAHYIDRPETVEFSCAEKPSQMITISK